MTMFFTVLGVCTGVAGLMKVIERLDEPANNGTIRRQAPQLMRRQPRRRTA